VSGIEATRCDSREDYLQTRVELTGRATTHCPDIILGTSIYSLLAVLALRPAANL